MDGQKYTIRFAESAFTAEEQRSNLQKKQKYTRAVAEAQKQVEALDSQDDFRDLLIDCSHYEKKRKGDAFGIERDRAIHMPGEDVILPHQKTAAQKFLRDLRGFGLLADVVGSGKTFEAGVILSELAVRGKMRSLLVVAPDQVFGNWVTVLQDKFGMGKNVLVSVRKEEGKEYPTLQEVLHETGVTKEGEFIRPARPIVVDADIFASWRYIPNFLADVVVVDEAHHLSEDAGKYAGSMRLLSEMMQTKKRAESTYCLLLTATPHSGNLENMFRLWYFVRCKGGNPPDFDEKDDGDRTEQYREEKKYYKNYICRGASNITEFIRKVKYDIVTQSYAAAFEKYLKAHNAAKGWKEKSEYDLSHDIDEFLHDETYADVRKDVLKRVSDAYHNGVLRSIMIRQLNKLPKRKTVYNTFFYPLSVPVQKTDTAGLNGDRITVDFSRLSPEGFPYVYGDGIKITPLNEYIENVRRQLSFAQAYSHILNALVGEWKKLDPQWACIHTKQGFEMFFADRLRDCQDRVAKNTVFLPVAHSSDMLGYKYARLTEILRKNADKRVLVFFDYNLPKDECAADAVCKALQSDKAFRDRVIVGDDKVNVADVEKKFKALENAVLVVKDVKFTEGANLQDSNIIVNYQVTYDPLAMDQRIGRIFRLGQKNDVSVYSLADMHRLEGFALAYFAEIGLMSGNTGDATILAGSNSDQMVALRCPACSRVVLLSRQAYEEKKKKDPDSLVCRDRPECRGYDGNGTEMAEITVYDFKCDTCGTVLTRSVSEGYMCLSHVADGERGKMCNSGEKGDRAIYCRKVCALSHCRRFTAGGYMENKCAALRRYRQKRNVSDAELMRLCALCTEQDCWDKCKISGAGKEQIEGKCATCEYAGCNPPPHVLRFNDKWEAECPMPSCTSHYPHGKLRPIVARTFATFIGELWKFEHDGGKGFCKNLGEQASVMKDVREILEKDDE